MRYHNITKDDMKNGDGLRVVLWTAGCEHKCKGCHNKCTWDKNGGLLFDEYAKREMFSLLNKPYISGLTLSGGDPLLIDTRDEIAQLLSETKNKFPDKTIWVYTGYLWEEVKDLKLMQNIDVLVDGKFILNLMDNNLKWRGSSNQRVIDVKESIKNNDLVLHCK